MDPNRDTSSYRGLPRGIWALGFVSMFMDISSEMIHALLPVYLVTVLGTSMATVGFIEGIAEATVMVTRLFSGALWDRHGPQATFLAGAAFTAVALVGLIILQSRKRGLQA